MIELKKAVPFELDSLEDLVSMISTAPPEQATILYFEKKGQGIFASFTVLPGYFEFRALPLLIYTREEELRPTGRFLKLDLRGETEIEFVSTLDEKELQLIPTGLIRFIPVVRLKKIPEIFDIDFDSEG